MRMQEIVERARRGAEELADRLAALRLRLVTRLREAVRARAPKQSPEAEPTEPPAPKPPPELPLSFMLSHLEEDGPVRLDGVKLGVCEVMGLEIDEPKLGAFAGALNALDFPAQLLVRQHSPRLERLREGELPGAVLVLAADPIRLRHVRRTLAGAPVPFYLALEREAVAASPDDPVWSPPAVSASVELRSVLDRIEEGSPLPEEDELQMASVPADLSVEGPGWRDLRLPAPRHPQARREAGPRPHLRLALDRPDRPGRTHGRVPSPERPSW